MSDRLTISPYLRQPLNRSYRDFLAEQIARLEAEPRRYDDQLAMLREEWERLSNRERSADHQAFSRGPSRGRLQDMGIPAFVDSAEVVCVQHVPFVRADRWPDPDPVVVPAVVV